MAGPPRGKGALKLPLDIFEEITAGTDDLCQWLKSADHKDALVLDEEVDARIVQRVLSDGYSPRLSDTDMVKLGRDPFLIAAALAAPSTRIVVTTKRFPTLSTWRQPQGAGRMQKPGSAVREPVSDAGGAQF